MRAIIPSSENRSRYLCLALAWALASVLLYAALVATVDSDRNIIENLLLNSDVLYPYLFARDLLGGVSIRGWNPPPAHCLFPDFFLVLISVSIVDFLQGDAVWAVILAGGLLGLTWMIAYAWLFRVLARYSGRELHPEQQLRIKLIAPLAGALLFAWIALGPGVNILAFLFAPTFHAGAVLMLPICTGLTLIALHSSGRTRALALFGLALVITLTSASDRIFYPGCLLPLVLIPPLLGRRTFSDLAWLGAAVVVGVLCGEWLNARIGDLLVLNQIQLTWGRLLEPDFISRALPAAVEVISGIFASMPGVPFLFSVAAFGFVLFVITQPRTDYGDRLVAAVVCAHLAMILFLFGAMLTVGYVVNGDSAVLRYVAPAMSLPFLPAIFAVVWVSRRGRTVKIFSGWRGPLLLILAIGIAAYWLPRRPVSIAHAYARGPAFQLAECMNQNRARLGRFGFAGYWNAKSATFLSQGHFQVNQLTANLDLMHWVNNFEWYYAPHAPGAGGTRFLIADDLDRARIGERFGPATDAFECAGHEFLIYDPKINPRLAQAYPPEFLDLALQLTGRRRH